LSPPSPESKASMFPEFLTQQFMGVPVGVWGIGIAVTTAITVAIGKQKNWW
jgi:hypothetical protein